MEPSAKTSPFRSVRSQLVDAFEDPALELGGRRRVFRACVYCRQRKIRCSGQEEGCTNCAARSIACTYKKVSMEENALARSRKAMNKKHLKPPSSKRHAHLDRSSPSEPAHNSHQNRPRSYSDLSNSSLAESFLSSDRDSPSSSFSRSPVLSSAIPALPNTYSPASQQVYAQVRGHDRYPSYQNHYYYQETSHTPLALPHWSEAWRAQWAQQDQNLYHDDFQEDPSPATSSSDEGRPYVTKSPYENYYASSSSEPTSFTQTPFAAMLAVQQAASSVLPWDASHQLSPPQHLMPVDQLLSSVSLSDVCPHN